MNRSAEEILEQIQDTAALMERLCEEDHKAIAGRVQNRARQVLALLGLNPADPHLNVKIHVDRMIEITPSEDGECEDMNTLRRLILELNTTIFMPNFLPKPTTNP